MCELLSQVVRLAPFGPYRKIRRFVTHPVRTQAELLRRLLRRSAGTEWGRRFGFEELARQEDVISAYQERVPLHDYEHFRTDIDRVRRGAADVFWPGKFAHFAVSSGTASSGKLIPVSTDMLAENNAFSIGVGLNYLAASGNPSFLFGKHLTLPGRIEKDTSYGEIMVGEVSGLQAEHAPSFFQGLYQAVPNEIAFLPHWERKLEAIVERTIGMDIRLIVMVPSWAMVFFKLLIERYNMLNNRNVSTVGEVWPNLQVFMSGGVALSSYRSLLDSLIGKPDLHYVETYGASEGFFAFQSDLDDPSLLLHLDNGVFFEFVRMDELNREGARRYTIRDVEPDVRYAMYVTTCSGLWSYAVRDVIRFTSTSPHKIIVAGRTSEMIDKYGEAVFSEEARAAILHACEVTGAQVLNFHVAPRAFEPDRMPAHQWLIEFENPPADLQQFAQAVDDHLQKVNRHYQIRREARAFEMPEIVVLPEGTFYRWIKNTRGKLSGQTKVPRLSEERNVADGVLALVGNDR